MRENNTLNMGRGSRTVKSVLSVLLIVYSPVSYTHLTLPTKLEV